MWLSHNLIPWWWTSEYSPAIMRWVTAMQLGLMLLDYGKHQVIWKTSSGNAAELLAFSLSLFLMSPLFLSQHSFLPAASWILRQGPNPLRGITALIHSIWTEGKYAKCCVDGLPVCSKNYFTSKWTHVKMRLQSFEKSFSFLSGNTNRERRDSSPVQDHCKVIKLCREMCQAETFSNPLVHMEWQR